MKLTIAFYLKIGLIDKLKKIQNTYSTYVQKNTNGEIMTMNFYNFEGENYSTFDFIQNARHKVDIRGTVYQFKNNPHEHQKRLISTPKEKLKKTKWIVWFNTISKL